MRLGRNFYDAFSKSEEGSSEGSGQARAQDSAAVEAAGARDGDMLDSHTSLSTSLDVF